MREKNKTGDIEDIDRLYLPSGYIRFNEVDPEYIRNFSFLCPLSFLLLGLSGNLAATNGWHISV